MSPAAASPAPAVAGMSCPSCGGADRVESIYRLERVPAQSTLLVQDRAAALGFPSGSLDLCWCPCCGLAFNAAFEAELVDYRSDYRDSQAGSPTFLVYAAELARDWVARHGLAGGHLVEVGCGQGDFLRLICAEGGCSGEGFDPACARPVAGEVTLRAEAFGSSHVPIAADFLICRHTLEHVGDVAGFLGLIRRAVAGERAPRVGFEVPDFRRILAEGAFWDVYYEHASYFTAGSLARAFAGAGFRVLDVRRVYGDQYLVLDAQPGTKVESPQHPLADDLAETACLVADFRDRATRSIAAWRARFDAWGAEGRRVALWGSGSKAVGFLTTIGRAGSVSCVVDINPDRQGWYMPGCGMPIVAPAGLLDHRPDIVIVMNPIYAGEIADAVRALGLTCEIRTVTDALTPAGAASR